MPSTLLGVFARYWQPGKVKTRLAATLGDQVAAALHRTFLTALLERFAAIADCRVLAYCPAEREEEFHMAAGRDWQIMPQTGGDLGRRMRDFFDVALAKAQRAVLIGSDSPDLPTKYVIEAFEALRSHDVVLGPAADGGYYLVGASRQAPIFEGIAWGTPGVWPQTTARLLSAGIDWHELPRWYDVDDQASLDTLLRNLQAEGLDHSLRQLQARLHAILGHPPGG